jgi:hypothetical protein
MDHSYTDNILLFSKKSLAAKDIAEADGLTHEERQYLSRFEERLKSPTKDEGYHVIFKSTYNYKELFFKFHLPRTFENSTRSHLERHLEERVNQLKYLVRKISSLQK